MNIIRCLLAAAVIAASAVALVIGLSSLPAAQTCAACGTVATTVRPWWYDALFALAGAVIVAELAIINWTRWRVRSVHCIQAEEHSR